MMRALLVGLSILMPTVPVHVRPATGGPRTTFTISLRVPVATGATGSLRRVDQVSLVGPRRAGCVWSAQAPLRAAAAHQLVRLRLAPAGPGARWCAGTFNGTVTQTTSIVCEPLQLCPMLMIVPQTIGRFRFRVS